MLLTWHRVMAPHSIKSLLVIPTVRSRSKRFASIALVCLLATRYPSPSESSTRMVKSSINRRVRRNRHDRLPHLNRSLQTITISPPTIRCKSAYLARKSAPTYSRTCAASRLGIEVDGTRAPSSSRCQRPSHQKKSRR